MIEAAMLAGRIIVGGYFLLMALNHFMHMQGMVGYAESKGFPLPKTAVIVSAFFMIVGGLGVIFWQQVALSLILLMTFLFVAALSIHRFWEVQDEQGRMTEMVNFTKNFALIGTLLIILSFVA